MSKTPIPAEGMKTATHTKGPWHVGMKPGPIIYGPSGEQIADMRETMLDPDEHKANIALIAASPLLLAACEAYLAKAKAGDSTLDCFAQIQTAVRKALKQ